MHGHLSLYVCILGCLFNAANILVLTHQDMILFGIAVADCLNMLEYIPFNIHMYLLDREARLPEDMVRI